MTTPRTDEQPIVCTLAAADYWERLAWIVELNRDALRQQRRNDLRLELTYAPQAAARVREMVEREQECCAFLTFELREDVDAARLTIVAPEAAREDADLLFEPFLSSGAAETACACTATAPTNDAIANRSASGRGVGAVAAAAATGALACAASCVLPFAMPAVMLTSAGSLIVWLAGASAWAAGLALIAVIGGWIWVGWQSARTRIRPAKSTLYAMSIATVVLALALGWPLYEAAVLRMAVSV